MLDTARIKAITLDLDDTLWPIGPTIARAENVLAMWLTQQAPGAAALFTDPQTRLALRAQVTQARPDLGHNLSALRLESIRAALHQAQEDTALAESAFEVFFAERMRVDLFDDVLPALTLLAARYPLLALTNGNAHVSRVGLGDYFTHYLSACDFGAAKPDVRIFQAAADLAGVTPAEVLHVGDDAAMDVMGALEAGMQAVWINRVGHTWSHGDTSHHTVENLTELVALLA